MNSQTDTKSDNIEQTEIITEHIIEGILFAMGESVSVLELSSSLNIGEDEVRSTLDTIAAKWEREKRGVRILKLDDAYQMCTSKDVYEYLIKIAKQPKKHVMTDVLLETLSIIAYKQPITKAEIERIRGVSCDHAVNKLVEYQLVEEIGRMDAPGRPMMFGTTEEFLRFFGVESLSALPSLAPEELERMRLESYEEVDRQLSISDVTTEE